MKDTFYNKETGHSVERESGWDNNGKNNFTNIQRSELAIAGQVKDVWSETTQTWEIDSASQTSYNNKRTAIQDFKDSPFNNVSVSEALGVIDSVTNIVSAKSAMKQIVKFQIGMREILRDIINHDK